MLKGKKILVGITGSIAAYKAAILIRLLHKQGAEVKVIMTASAKTFITPLTLSTLSKNPVYSAFEKPDGSGEWNNHVELALWADIMLIAPASANTLAKCAHGICDNLLLATYLSAKCPVVFAPAMDLDMYKHPSTLANLKTLQSYGNSIIEAEEGELASGLEGKGRMSEPEHIISYLEGHFTEHKALSGKKVMITAGPTYEAIDPVRFVGNHSSGKMGYALAEAFSILGAEVTLISGPTHLEVPAGVKNYIPIQSAADLLEASTAQYPASDIAILAAAVADYRPKNIAQEKIKKKDDDMHIALEKTADIAKTLGQRKQKGQLNIGFALETENEEENAKAKLQNKNFDLIVLNSLKDKGAGFGHDTNKVRIYNAAGLVHESETESKKAIAHTIAKLVAEQLS